jgi:competence protein ComEC
MRQLIFVTIFFLVGVHIQGCASSGLGVGSPPEGVVRWHVLDVSDDSGQADANLIQFQNGLVVLIDAGERTQGLVTRLEEQGVDRIDKIFISHPHKDHYSGIVSLLDAQVKIGEVYINEPPKALCDAEIPWGCDMGDIGNLIMRLKSLGVPVKSMTAGETYIKFDSVELTAVYAHDGISPPVGPTDINDLSVIMSLRNGDIRALFTGDLNLKFGQYLSSLADVKLKAQLLKVPHHGTEGLAPDSFFEWVAPEVGFIPAPASLWLSERSKRPRDWFKNHNTPVYVTGIDGAVMIDILQTEYKIRVLK